MEEKKLEKDAQRVLFLSDSLGRSGGCWRKKLSEIGVLQ